MTTEQTKKSRSHWRRIEPLFYAMVAAALASGATLLLHSQANAPQLNQAAIHALQTTTQRNQGSIQALHGALRTQAQLTRTLTQKVLVLQQQPQHRAITPLYRQLDSLRQRIIAYKPSANESAGPHKKHAQAESKTSQWHALGQSLRQFFTIRKLDKASPLLATSSQQKQLLLNAQQSLALAQWALMNNDRAAYEYGIQHAIEILQAMPTDNTLVTLTNNLRQVQSPTKAFRKQQEGS